MLSALGKPGVVGEQAVMKQGRTVPTRLLGIDVLEYRIESDKSPPGLPSHPHALSALWSINLEEPSRHPSAFD